MHALHSPTNWWAFSLLVTYFTDGKIYQHVNKYNVIRSISNGKAKWHTCVILFWLEDYCKTADRRKTFGVKYNQRF